MTESAFYSNMVIFKAVLLSLFILNVWSFRTLVKPHSSSGYITVRPLCAAENNGETESQPSQLNKKAEFLKRSVQFGKVAVQTLTASSMIAAASTSATHAATSNSADLVAVLGSGGRTGQLVVSGLAKKGYRVRPVFRGQPKGVDNLGDSLLPPAQADVTKIDTLESAISGATTVVFAASASRNGGSAQQVDYAGVENVAKECVRLKIPRLVVVSSGAITRPDSLGFKITNLFGNIMNYKLQGENALRNAYKAANDKSLNYVIVRPGGLTDGDPEGPTKIELNQGDTISGEINRSDVAECVVAAAVSKTLPGSVTFEVYQNNRRGPLQAEFPQRSGFERDGAVLGGDYDVLFKGLKVDNAD